MKERIIVVEDDNNILELITYNLTENSYEVDTAQTGNDALEKIIKNNYDLIVLDIMLPGVNGIDICKTIRNDYKSNVPIIMLTAKSEEIDKLLGLELGADDYMTKPFSVRELVARVKTILRRTNSKDNIDANNIIITNGIEINKEKHEIKANGILISLTLKEFELLTMLAENSGKVLSRNQLLDRIWGYDYIGESRTVDVHVRYLRKKIGDEEGLIIETVRGIGYKIS